MASKKSLELKEISKRVEKFSLFHISKFLSGYKKNELGEDVPVYKTQTYIRENEKEIRKPNLLHNKGKRRRIEKLRGNN